MCLPRDDVYEALDKACTYKNRERLTHDLPKLVQALAARFNLESL